METKKYKLPLKRRLQLRKKAREYRKLNPEKYRKRSRDWKRNHPKQAKESYKKFYNSPAGKWCALKYNGKENKREISKKDFLEWYKNQKRICIYCGVKEEDLKTDKFQPKSFRERLQVDRKDNEKGYKKGNLALACRCCNQIKSNIFSFQEMKEIGKIIKRKRNIALGNI